MLRAANRFTFRRTRSPKSAGCAAPAAAAAAAGRAAALVEKPAARTRSRRLAEYAAAGPSQPTNGSTGLPRSVSTGADPTGPGSRREAIQAVPACARRVRGDGGRTGAADGRDDGGRRRPGRAGPVGNWDGPGTGGQAG
ncbi:hypothetical protein GCM10010505_29300 [Kitasatospora aburaviensis]